MFVLLIHQTSLSSSSRTHSSFDANRGRGGRGGGGGHGGATRYFGSQQSSKYSSSNNSGSYAQPQSSECLASCKNRTSGILYSFPSVLLQATRARARPLVKVPPNTDRADTLPEPTQDRTPMRCLPVPTTPVVRRDLRPTCERTTAGACCASMRAHQCLVSCHDMS